VEIMNIASLISTGGFVIPVLAVWSTLTQFSVKTEFQLASGLNVLDGPLPVARQKLAVMLSVCAASDLKKLPGMTGAGVM
jgi:hypothetical protein